MLKKPMNKFKIAIFDLDGTLVDSRKDISISINVALKQMGFPVLSLEAVLEKIGWGMTNLIQQCIPFKLKNDTRSINETLACFEKHHLKQCTKNVQCYDGVTDFLSSQSDLIHILLTNKNEIYTYKILHHLNLSLFFKKVIGGDTLSVKKPNPQALDIILKSFPMPKENIVMIGDGAPDISFAHNAGISSIAILGGGISNTNLILEKKPTYHCQTFTEVKSFF